MRTGQLYRLSVKLKKGIPFKDFEIQLDIIEDKTPVSDCRMMISRYVPPRDWSVAEFIMEPVDA